MRTVLGGLRLPSRADAGELWRKCRPFLIFNTPYSLVGALGREVPIFAFAAVAATATAGQYGLARTLLGAPATLLAASLSQVFYREAAEHRGTARLEAMTLGLLRLTLTATAPAFAFVVIWGDVAFSVAFGTEWATAGRYAMILAPAAWLSIQTAWPERLYESVGRQGVSFAIQIGFDALAAAVVFGAVFSGLAPITVVALFAVVNCVFHLTYLTGMFRVAALPLRGLAGALALGAAMIGASIGVMWAVRSMDMSPAAGMVAAGVVATLAGGGLALTGYRQVRRLVNQ